MERRSQLHCPRAGAVRLGCALLIALLAPGARGDEAAPGDPIERGNAAFEARFEIATMHEAIAAYEAALADLESHPPEIQTLVLNRLAQLHYELTTFSPGNTAEDAAAFRAGKEYGLRSLRLNPEFAALEEEDFDAAVAVVVDPAALLWTADNWGALFQIDPISGFLHLGKVRALYERCLAVDETYWGASAHNALGAMLIVTPAALGGNEDAGLVHLERALSLDATYLENRVVYAQYWGFTYDLFGRVSGVRDAKFLGEELHSVLAAPIGDWPFWNREAKREADRLLAELEERVP